MLPPAGIGRIGKVRRIELIEKTSKLTGPCIELTGSHSPSGDVAEVVVGQNLAVGRQRAQLGVGIKGHLRGQLHQGNVEPEVEI